MKVLKHHPLSNDEIEKTLNYNVHIIKYSDIEEFKNIKELFNNKKYVIILWDYQQSPNTYGHWTCLHFVKNNNTLSYFDSYGYKPEQVRSFVSKYYKNVHYPAINYLNKLLREELKNNKTKIIYNHHKLQKLNQNIETCGHWCIYRCLRYDLDENEFYELFKPVKNKDNLIILLTYNLLNN
jgi:hypothetical protein